MTVVLTPGVPVRVERAVITVSFSGNAFSVTRRAREVQIAARPGFLRAEAAKVVDDLADLFLPSAGP